MEEAGYVRLSEQVGRCLKIVKSSCSVAKQPNEVDDEEPHVLSEGSKVGLLGFNPTLLCSITTVRDCKPCNLVSAEQDWIR